jgi:hypothetical protein
MSKNNAKNNYSSTNHAKVMIKNLIKRKKRKKKCIYKKMGLKV